VKESKTIKRGVHRKKSGDWTGIGGNNNTNSTSTATAAATNGEHVSPRRRSKTIKSLPSPALTGRSLAKSPISPDKAIQLPDLVSSSPSAVSDMFPLSPLLSSSAEPFASATNHLSEEKTDDTVLVLAHTHDDDDSSSSDSELVREARDVAELPIIDMCIEARKYRRAYKELGRIVKTLDQIKPLQVDCTLTTKRFPLLRTRPSKSNNINNSSFNSNAAAAADNTKRSADAEPEYEARVSQSAGFAQLVLEEIQPTSHSKPSESQPTAAPLSSSTTASMLAPGLYPAVTRDECQETTLEDVGVQPDSYDHLESAAPIIVPSSTMDSMDSIAPIPSSESAASREENEAKENEDAKDVASAANDDSQVEKFSTENSSVHNDHSTRLDSEEKTPEDVADSKPKTTAGANTKEPSADSAKPREDNSVGASAVLKTDTTKDKTGTERTDVNAGEINSESHTQIPSTTTSLERRTSSSFDKRKKSKGTNKDAADIVTAKDRPPEDNVEEALELSSSKDSEKTSPKTAKEVEQEVLALLNAENARKKGFSFKRPFSSRNGGKESPPAVATASSSDAEATEPKRDTMKNALFDLLKLPSTKNKNEKKSEEKETTDPDTRKSLSTEEELLMFLSKTRQGKGNDKDATLSSGIRARMMRRGSLAGDGSHPRLLNAAPPLVRSSSDKQLGAPPTPVHLSMSCDMLDFYEGALQGEPSGEHTRERHQDSGVRVRSIPVDDCEKDKAVASFNRKAANPASPSRKDQDMTSPTSLRRKVSRRKSSQAELLHAANSETTWERSTKSERNLQADLSTNSDTTTEIANDAEKLSQLSKKAQQQKETPREAPFSVGSFIAMDAILDKRYKSIMTSGFASDNAIQVYDSQDDVDDDDDDEVRSMKIGDVHVKDVLARIEDSIRDSSLGASERSLLSFRVESNALDASKSKDGGDTTDRYGWSGNNSTHSDNDEEKGKSQTAGSDNFSFDFGAHPSFVSHSDNHNNDEENFKALCQSPLPMMNGESYSKGKESNQDCADIIDALESPSRHLQGVELDVAAIPFQSFAGLIMEKAERSHSTIVDPEITDEDELEFSSPLHHDATEHDEENVVVPLDSENCEDVDAKMYDDYTHLQFELAETEIKLREAKLVVSRIEGNITQMKSRLKKMEDKYPALSSTNATQQQESP
jgi:hypothetical protein